MHQKEDIYKKRKFSHTKMAKSKNYEFFVNNSFMHFFSQIYVCFSESQEYYVFVCNREDLFGATKIWPYVLYIGDLDFCIEEKNLHYYAKSQNKEKCLFYFGLRILTLIQ